METKRKRGRPSSKKQLDKETLYQLALRAFARNGFEGVRMSALAKEAGIANSLLNYYFESKEDLWKQSMIFIFDKLKDKFRTVYRNFKDVEGVSLLKVSLRQLVYFSIEFPEYQVIYSQEMARKSERADWLIKNLLSPIHEKTDEIYLKEQANGNIKNIPVMNLSVISVGATNAFMAYTYFLKAIYNIDTSDEILIEKFADDVIEVFFNGILVT